MRNIPNQFGVRLYQVAVTTRTWTGSRPGLGTFSDTTTGLKVDLGIGPVKARQMSGEEIVASGGVYGDELWEIGPITPPYPGSSPDNDGIAVFDPPVVGPNTEIFYTLTGPGLSAPANTFKKVARRVDRAFRYMFTLQKTATTPFAFTPKTLTGLLLWLKADAGVTQTGGFASVWADQSTHGNNATQATGGIQPAVSSFASGAIALSFPNSAKMVLTSAVFDGLSAATFFIVHNTTQDPENNGGVWGGNIAFGIEVYDNAPGDGRALRVNGTRIDANAFTYGADTITECVYDGTTGGGTATSYVNGSSHGVTTGLGATLSSGSSHTIGAYAGVFYAPTTIGEIVAYSRALSTTERKSVESYLSNRYNIPVGS